MKRILACLVLIMLVGCGTTVVQSTPQDDAARSAAAVKVGLTAAYHTTADLLQAGVLSIDKAKDIYINLSRAEVALNTAELNLVSNPTSAQAYIATAWQIVSQVLDDLNAMPPPPKIVPLPKVTTDSTAGG